MDLDSTIVAISSANGHAKRALLRISGPNAICGSKSLGLSPNFGSIESGYILFGEHELPVLVGAFKKNASYTGEDLVEIQFAGNPLLASRLVELFIKATDGREATAGEFTARAFFSGRISLAQAEGVSATISASNNAELSGAALLREGVLTALTNPLTSQITKLLALIEAGIDFTDEEDVVAITETKLAAALTTSKATLRALIDNSIPMSSLRNLPKIVLVGKPNAGKSTLFNALVGKPRVVVASESGTTRDAIEEVVEFGSTRALLVDIAGLENGACEITSSAQISAQNAITSADILLWCLAPNDTLLDFDKRTIVVYTKADQRENCSGAINAITGTGMGSLRNHIETQLQAACHPSVEAVAILPRHEKQLKLALHCIEEAEQCIQTPEFCAASLRSSLHALGEITGKISPDDVLGHIFSSFCVGK